MRRVEFVGGENERTEREKNGENPKWPILASGIKKYDLRLKNVIVSNTKGVLRA